VSWRTTGILFLILLTVAAVVLIVQRQPPGDELATPTGPASFTEALDLFDGVTIDEVVRLEIARSAPPDEAHFDRDAEGAWSQTAPTATQVISATLTNQVTGLLNTRVSRSFTAENGDLAPYGLDDPQATIVLAVQDAGSVVRFELALGDLTPIGDAYYVLKPGDPRVHLMSSASLDSVLRLLDTAPLPVTPAP
jgi:hypothetical protein